MTNKNIKTNEEQDTKKQKKKLSVFQILIICFSAFIIIFTTIITIYFVNKDSNNLADVTSSTDFTIYNETWTVYHNQDNEISSIYTFYQYNEQTSQYWKDLATQHGDSSIYVTHSITKKGKPSNTQNWFVIEETETVMNGWTHEVLFEKTIKYEQKLNFELS